MPTKTIICPMIIFGGRKIGLKQCQLLYLCHKWPQICPVCRNHNLELSSFMTYNRLCNKSNTMGATCGAGTAYPSGAPEFTPVFSGVRVVQSLVFCEMLCRSLLSFCYFSFSHCIVCPSSIYSFWLPLWYLQTFFMVNIQRKHSIFSLKWFIW